MQARTLFFTAPKQVEIRETRLRELQENEVLVETICSAISAGTEMLIYRGQFPQLADSHDAVSSELNYPLAYGYACVGVVREIGRSVPENWRGRRVFSFQPHTSHFISAVQNLLPIPDDLSPHNACFLPNMETAVNLVQDGAPILGERVLVLGQGVVGLLTTSLLSEFPLDCLVTVDAFEARRRASEGIRGVTSHDVGTPLIDYTQNKFDLTYELSGVPSALNDAIAHTAFSGRVVIGSWYGEKRTEIDLGGAFHRSRIKLISSQVSTIAPELAGRWDKPRRFDIAWKALGRVQPQRWITHRFPLHDAAKAYELLDQHPQETIQVIFNHEI